MIARVYKYFRWLSLDVSVGAIVLSAFFSQELGVNSKWEELVCLGLGVLLIYNIDHFKDVQSISVIPASRRIIHKEYSRLILILIALSLISGFLLAFRLDWYVQISGTIIVLCSSLYLLFTRKIEAGKEILIALIYGIGVMLIPLIRLEFSWLTLVTTIAMSIVAMINLLLFSIIEYEEDVQDGFGSLVRRISLSASNRLLLFLMIILVFILTWLIPQNFLIGIYLLACVVCYLLIWQLGWFRNKDRYRIFGDGLFLFPTVLLF